MDKRYSIDTNTRGGAEWFQRWAVRRLVYFFLGVWPFMVIGLYPFWRATAEGYGRWGYAFWWALILGVPAGYLFHLFSMAIDAAKVTNAQARAEAEAAAREAAKTPEQRAAEAAAREAETAQRRAEMRQQFIGLHLGDSVGMMYGRGHVGGVPQGQHVELAREDASKNIIIFGGTGGGKTSRSINPLLRQLFMQNAGALIFDIKTDFIKEVGALTNMAGRSFKIVGDGGMTLNLFRGCTPELAASYLKSCFLVQGQGSGDSAFWVDSSVEMARHCLNLLNLLRPHQYSIASLYDIVFDNEARNALVLEGTEKLSEMSDRDQRLFNQSSRFFVNVWNEHDEKLRKNILGTMNAVLSPFAHPDMVDAFSTGSEQGEADMTELVNDGAVFLVNLPMTKYGREGARFAYLLVKLRFMNMMRERRTKPEWNQDRPVAFVCDEYQAIVDPISDTDFWDKSRSTRTIGIVSMQGVASLVHALGNNKAVAEAILQNFRQRIIFRTEDEATLRHIRDVLGQVDVHVTSTGYSASESETLSGVNAFGGKQLSLSSSESESENTSIQRQDLFGANDMRSLSADYCLFVGNVGDRAVDEVLAVKPLYV
ncbi:type IV secretory system conjugative DNA transfer family protein [Salmonella enterica subsp. enterica]|nr:type IV secretory system conjugative DNA transfer family protein [Salmonella enterica]EAW1132054.1 type IV secretory system conjugative DNA transfer family protein [Salmonella enterica subsp. enterica]EDQ6130698.1 type IV secretory system conjugative DNA transfer family protein [Salmonella enterica subsp. enterica serovar Bredeney]EEJ8487029.1 type IV secretory system conjugative DNA transfer family protein [Salmonella enterica subsp. enterica serovar Bredeney]